MTAAKTHFYRSHDSSSYFLCGPLPTTALRCAKQQSGDNQLITQYMRSSFPFDPNRKASFLKFIQNVQSATVDHYENLQQEARGFGLLKEDFQRIWDWSRHRYGFTQSFTCISGSYFFTRSIADFLKDLGYSKREIQGVSLFSQGRLSRDTVASQSINDVPAAAQPVAVPAVLNISAVPVGFCPIIKEKIADPLYRRLFLNYMGDTSLQNDVYIKSNCYTLLFHAIILHISVDDWQTISRWMAARSAAIHPFDGGPIALFLTDDLGFTRRELDAAKRFSDVLTNLTDFEKLSACYQATSFYSSRIGYLLDQNDGFFKSILWVSLDDFESYVKGTNQSLFDNNLLDDYSYLLKTRHFFELYFVVSIHAARSGSQLRQTLAERMAGLQELLNMSSSAEVKQAFQDHNIDLVMQRWPAAVGLDVNITDKNQRRFLLRALDFALVNGWSLATKFILDQFTPTGDDEDPISSKELLLTKGELVSCLDRSLMYLRARYAPLILYAYNQNHFIPIRSDEKRMLQIKRYVASRRLQVQGELFSGPSRPRLPAEFLKEFTRQHVSRDPIGGPDRSPTALETFGSSPLFDANVLRTIARFTND